MVDITVLPSYVLQSGDVAMKRSRVVFGVNPDRLTAIAPDTAMKV
jgi:hypothetical protein